MRRIFIVALVASAAAFVALGGGRAARADDSGAAVYRDFGCGLSDGNGNFVFTTDTHSVEVGNNGNGLTICKASGVPNSTGKAVHWDSASTNGGTCFIRGQFGTDWDITVSAGGEAILRCHLNGSS